MGGNLYKSWWESEEVRPGRGGASRSLCTAGAQCHGEILEHCENLPQSDSNRRQGSCEWLCTENEIARPGGREEGRKEERKERKIIEKMVHF